MTKPYITVITSTYNAAKTLRRCLDSVKNQSYHNIEHIIIDGNSSDGTQDIIAEYAETENTCISYWVSEPDSGIYNAWNKAIPHINGDWVLFLGADDYYSGNIFEEVVPILQELPQNTHIAYGKVSVFDAETNEVIRTLGKNWDYHKKGFFNGLLMLPHQGVFHRKTVFEKSDKFNDTYRIAADYAYLYPILETEEPMFIDKIIAMYSNEGVSSNLENSIQCLDEYEDTVNKHGRKVSLLFRSMRLKTKMLLFCKRHNLKLIYTFIDKTYNYAVKYI